MPKNIKLKKFQAILFDLDGTLIDTAPDLAAALNHVLQSEHKSQLSLRDIRPISSDGALGLLKLGFNIDQHHPDYNRLREKLLQYYQANIHQKSRLFQGMDEILNQCEHKKIPWGIVTNKAGYLTEHLLKKLNLHNRVHCVVSGDTLKQRKPDPAPLLYAAKLLNIEPQNCCYIGDAERDVIAAKAANMFIIAAVYGYIPLNTNPLLWQADVYINSPSELSDWIY